MTERDRKEKTIEAHNRFKDALPDKSRSWIILNRTKSSFYNISRLKADPNNIRFSITNYLNAPAHPSRHITHPYGVHNTTRNNQRRFKFRVVP